MLKRLATSLFKRKPEPGPTRQAAASVATFADASGAQVARTVQDGVAANEGALEKAADRLRGAPVAPALIIATGAGVAFWYWTQWARGQAESEAAGETADDRTD